MHVHPDITHQLVRQRYSELLAEARRERLAALAAGDPDLRSRLARVQGVVSGLHVKLVRRRPAHKPGLGTAS
jgi:hypothetical protein